MRTTRRSATFVALLAIIASVLIVPQMAALASDGGYTTPPPSHPDSNKADPWKAWGLAEFDEVWECTKVGDPAKDGYVLPSPESDRVWRLLVVNAGQPDDVGPPEGAGPPDGAGPQGLNGSEGDDEGSRSTLFFDPEVDETYVNDQTGDVSNVIACSMSIPSQDDEGPASAQLTSMCFIGDEAIFRLRNTGDRVINAPQLSTSQTHPLQRGTLTDDGDALTPGATVFFTVPVAQPGTVVVQWERFDDGAGTITTAGQTQNAQNRLPCGAWVTPEKNWDGPGEGDAGLTLTYTGAPEPITSLNTQTFGFSIEAPDGTMWDRVDADETAGVGEWLYVPYGQTYLADEDDGPWTAAPATANSGLGTFTVEPTDAEDLESLTTKPQRSHSVTNTGVEIAELGFEAEGVCDPDGMSYAFDLDGFDRPIQFATSSEGAETQFVEVPLPGIVYDLEFRLDDESDVELLEDVDGPTGVIELEVIEELLGTTDLSDFQVRGIVSLGFGLDVPVIVLSEGDQRFDDVVMPSINSSWADVTIDCEAPVEPTPAITLVKDVDLEDDEPIVLGDDGEVEVTYTYLVTNTGDEALASLTLSDDRIDATVVQDAFEDALDDTYSRLTLEPTEDVLVSITVTLAADDFGDEAFDDADGEHTNIAVVTGTGVESGTSVDDDDAVTIVLTAVESTEETVEEEEEIEETIVAGETLEREPRVLGVALTAETTTVASGSLPETGASTWVLALFGALGLALGGTLLAASSRRFGARRLIDWLGAGSVTW